jgi:D-glycero-D-manno-heptose 1,7-bisphosphate phosphatase
VKVAILDRDGVINRDSEQFIKSPEEFHMIPGSAEAIARLNHAGYHVVVATNQSGVGRGLFDMATLNAINEKMMRLVGLSGGRIDAVFYCPCAADAHCECRKPQAGMFREIAERYGVDLTGAPSVGDSLRDLQAGAQVGAQPILVLTGKGQNTRAAGGLPEGTRIYADLAEAARALVG